MKSFRIFLTSLFTLLTVMPNTFAAMTYELESPTGLLPLVGTLPGDTIAKIIAYFISLTAIFAIIAITWGAIQMILASGEEEKVKKSRMIIIYAFVGLLVSGIAYGIVKMVTNLTL